MAIKVPAVARQVEAEPVSKTMVPLLAIALFINYVDRGNLATAAPLIKEQLHLSATQFGMLVSAFFWTYMPAQILASWVAERITPYRTLALGVALWAIATAATGLVSGFGALIGLRLLLGLGESAAFPCSSKLLAQHLACDKLGKANGLIAVGQALGPAFGTFVGGMLMAKIGWRDVFLVFGLFSLLWLVPWRAATRHLSAQANNRSDAPAPSFAAILRRRELWGASFGHFCGNYAFYFVVTWLPLYLVKERGMSVERMAVIGGLIYVVYAVSSWLTGMTTDRCIRAGIGRTRVRKTAILSSFAIMAASLICAGMGDVGVSIASLFCAGFALGLGTPNVFAIGQILAGPQAAGKWMAIQNCIANLAGIIAPIITGFVVDRTGQFHWAFFIAAAMSGIGMVGWGVVIRRVEPLEWETKSGLAGRLIPGV